MTETNCQIPTYEETTLEDCDAMLVCLSNRRFVVIRIAEPKHLWPLRGGWDNIRRLKAGDEVIYQGHRSTVRAVDVY